jgi:RNA polymerase sigma-70 factor (ECF subfamily)
MTLENMDSEYPIDAETVDATMRREIRAEDYRAYLLVLARMELARAERVRPKADASDIVQDTLLKAHRGRDQFRGASEGEFKVWLRRILANVVTDAMRRWGTEKRDTALEEACYDDLSRYSVRLDALIPAPQDSPSQQVAKKERAALIAGALNDLPEEQRCAIELRYLREYSMRETAATMQRSEASVAGLVRRGLETLNRKLDRG